jgi:carboxypeptidase family protein
MLNAIRVASPCRASWEKMEGDERMRHCPACNLDVYNFAAMSECEVRALIANNKGRLCARLFRRRDGTILTQNCPVGLRSLKRRLSRIAGAILSVMTPAFSSAQTLAGYVKSNVNDASLELYVVDPQGTPMPKVTVTLRSSTKDKKEKQVQRQTDSGGRVRIASHTAGKYSFSLTTPGFQPYEESVELRSGEMLSLRVPMMSAATMGEVILIEPRYTQADAPVRYNFARVPLVPLPQSSPRL